jgi:hypothetical protein
MVTEFEKRFEELANAARERFEREGAHEHLIYLFSSERSDVQEVPFWAIIQAMPGGNIHTKKERAYKTVASMMSKRNFPGYVEASEFWIATFKAENSEVLSRYNQVVDRYGSIERMPGRDEWFIVSGRFGQETKGCHWKIRRRDKEVWLEGGLEGWTVGGNISKSSVLDRASIDLCGKAS